MVSFSIRMPLSGRFTDWPCLGHRPGPWTSLWLPVLLELHGVREGWFPKDRGAEQTKHCMFMTQWSVPFGLPYFSFPGTFLWGSMAKPRWNLYYYPQNTRLLKKYNHRPTLGYRCWDHMILLFQRLGQNPSLVLAVLFWEAVGQAGPGWVPGSGLSLTN